MGLIITTLNLQLIQANQNSSTPIRIMIDPGHGGSDSGATLGPIREADIALNVSLYLKKYLDRDPRFGSLLTRTSNSNLSLEDRINITEKASRYFHQYSCQCFNDKRVKGFGCTSKPPSCRRRVRVLANTENELPKDNIQRTEDQAKATTFDPSSRSEKKSQNAIELPTHPKILMAESNEKCHSSGSISCDFLHQFTRHLN